MEKGVIFVMLCLHFVIEGCSKEKDCGLDDHYEFEVKEVSDLAISGIFKIIKSGSNLTDCRPSDIPQEPIIEHLSFRYCRYTQDGQIQEVGNIEGLSNTLLTIPAPPDNNVALLAVEWPNFHGTFAWRYSAEFKSVEKIPAFGEVIEFREIDYSMNPNDRVSVFGLHPGYNCEPSK